MQDALHELGLQSAWDRFDIDYTAVHEMLGQTFTSTLDHFAWSELLDSSVVDAGVLHLPDNKSDHSPIYCTVNMSSIEHDFSQPKPSKPRPSWMRSTCEQKLEYKSLLEERLAMLTTPESVINCGDVHCRDSQHKEDLDKYTIEVLEAVQSVAEESLPVPASSNKDGRKISIRPGWLGEVKPYRDNAYFWHQIWKSAGRPINTQLHSIMKRTKNLYHYHYKKIKKAEEHIKRSKLLSACMGEGGDLFQEIKALRKSPPVIATSIDGISDNIPDHFGSIYSTLYNSADDVTELNLVHERVESAVNSSHIDAVLKITPDLLRKAVGKLKPGKSDPVYTFSSDCFKNATSSLY